VVGAKTEAVWQAGHPERLSSVTTVSLRQLNRWTLHRQMLLERVELDAVTAIDRLAGMQAQYSPSPYIGLWSRLRQFRREELESALMADQVLKATLMRGTLHVVSARQFDQYRVVSRNQNHIYTQTVKVLRERGTDVDAIRTAVLAAVRESPRTRADIEELVRPLVSADLPDYAGWSTVALSGDLMHSPGDAAYGYFGGGRYRLAPPVTCDVDDAFREVAASYFAAFGPATRADLAQWSGQSVGAFMAALGSLPLVTVKCEDGRALLDLADAPKSDWDGPAPVRFLSKWDNLLLAYDRRERVLPEPFRKIIIRKNGDMLPTFLVDGLVAGTWTAPARGRAVLTLEPLRPLASDERAEVAHEAERLLSWLRPDTDRRTIHWPGV